MLYTSVLMACPYPGWDPLVRQLLGPAQPILENLGLRHRLRLFAPNPPRWSRKLVFRVTYSDGTAGAWTYPRSALAPGDPPDSYNRYLFIYVFWTLQQKSTGLLADLARYIAIEAATPEHLPIGVDFVERFVAIPTPQEGIGAPLPQPKEEQVLVHYDVARNQIAVLSRSKL